MTDSGGRTARESTYLIGDTSFRVVYRDLTEVAADALVSSDDNYLTMGGGVSMALSAAGGRVVYIDAQKHIPAELGDVVVTTAGDLPAKYIFHGITIDHDAMSSPDVECVRSIVTRSLELAEQLRLRHIAFPALGTGVGGFPFELAAEVMTREIATFLAGTPSYLSTVTLTLYKRSYDVAQSQLDAFYERAVSIAAQWTDSRRLGDLVDELETLITRRGQGNLRARIRELRAEISSAEETLSEPEVSGTADAENPLHPATGKVDELAQASREVIDWEDIGARETVLRLRLQSLRTQHNILIGNRNQLEERKAKYGPTAVPLEVENALTDVLGEIVSREEEIRAVKGEIAKLADARRAAKTDPPTTI